MTWGPASDWEDDDGNPVRFIEHNPATGEPGRSWVERVEPPVPTTKPFYLKIPIRIVKPGEEFDQILKSEDER